MPTDYGGDHQFLERIETISITRIDGGAAVANVKGRKGSLTIADIQGGGSVGVSPGDVVWVLWLSTTGGYVPKNGDIINRPAPAETFTVLTVAGRSDDAQARVVSRKRK